MEWKIPEGTLIKDDIMELLRDLDFQILQKFGIPKHKYSAYIVGGAAIILHGLDEKKTADIDIVEASSVITSFLHTYGNGIINNKAEACLSDFPYDFPDRARLLKIGTKAIDFYVISIEDVIIAKLATPRTKDRVDIRRNDVIKNVDWDLLDILVKEHAKYALNETRASILRAQYKAYTKDVQEIKRKQSLDKEVNNEL